MIFLTDILVVLTKRELVSLLEANELVTPRNHDNKIEILERFYRKAPDEWSDNLTRELPDLESIVDRVSERENDSSITSDDLANVLDCSDEETETRFFPLNNTNNQKLRSRLCKDFPTKATLELVLADSEIDQTAIDMAGSVEKVWDNIIRHCNAEENSVLTGLLKSAYDRLGFEFYWTFALQVGVEQN